MVRRQPARAACFLAIGAGALSIVALLLPWYEYGVAREGLPSVSAFEAFSRGDEYQTAVAVAAIAAAVLNLLAPRKSFPLVLALLGASCSCCCSCGLKSASPARASTLPASGCI